MQYLPNPMNDIEIKSSTIQKLRSRYTVLAEKVEKINDGEMLYCHACDDYHPKEEFYRHEKYKSGRYPECRQALLDRALDYDIVERKYSDNKTKTIEVFKLLDVPFIDSIYEKALKKINEGEVSMYQTAYSATLKSVLDLPQFRGYHFSDSEFGEDNEYGPKVFSSPDAEDDKVIREGIKKFGPGFTSEDYAFLVGEYKDWISKYECDTKTQDEIFIRLCFKKWEIMKATKKGGATDNLDKSFQQLLTTGNLTPKQAAESGQGSSYTFGELLKRWEDTKPLPEIDPDLKDVDKIGLYYNIFIGHTSKMVGLKNAFSKIYERFIAKYTVKKPQSDIDDDSEAVFDKIFGSDLE